VGFPFGGHVGFFLLRVSLGLLTCLNLTCMPQTERGSSNRAFHGNKLGPWQRARLEQSSLYKGDKLRLGVFFLLAVSKARSGALACLFGALPASGPCDSKKMTLSKKASFSIGP